MEQIQNAMPEWDWLQLAAGEPEYWDRNRFVYYANLTDDGWTATTSGYWIHAVKADLLEPGVTAKRIVGEGPVHPVSAMPPLTTPGLKIADAEVRLQLTVSAQRLFNAYHAMRRGYPLGEQTTGDHSLMMVDHGLVVVGLWGDEPGVVQYRVPGVTVDGGSQRSALATSVWAIDPQAVMNAARGFGDGVVTMKVADNRLSIESDRRYALIQFRQFSQRVKSAKRHLPDVPISAPATVTTEWLAAEFGMPVTFVASVKVAP